MGDFGNGYIVGKICGAGLALGIMVISAADRDAKESNVSKIPYNDRPANVMTYDVNQDGIHVALAHAKARCIHLAFRSVMTRTDL